LAITRVRDVHEWGSTGEWWEGGDGVVWSAFCRVRHGCDSDLESVTHESAVERKVWYKCVGIKVDKLVTIDL
jgi:hypothetical protein